MRASPNGTPMNITDFVSPQYAIVGMRAADKARLLHELARRAATALGLPADQISDALLKREALGSTGTGGGIATGGGTATGGGGCQRESDATFCQRLGKACGAVSGTDNCGGSRTVSSCGTCSTGTCDGGVFLNRAPRADGQFASQNNGLACLCCNFMAQHPTDPNIIFTGLQDNGTARTGVVTTSIPAALMVANTSLIWGEASYLYRPTIGWTITGTLTLSDRFFLRPRLSNSVTLDSGSQCP